MLKYAAIFVAALVLSLNVFLWVENQLVPSYQSCVRHSAGEQSAEGSNNNADEIVIAFKARSICSLRLIDRHNGFFAFVAALVIAVFTIILAIVGYTQAALTRSSVKIAERSLTELERPWIFLDGANVKRREPSGSPIVPNNWEVKLGWQNVGRSPALIKTCVFEVVARSILAVRPDYAKCTYELACRASVPAGQGFLTNEIRLDPSELPTVDMVAYGRLTYAELNGTVHYSGFALEISQTEERFVAIHNDAYTYYT